MIGETDRAHNIDIGELLCLHVEKFCQNTDKGLSHVVVGHGESLEMRVAEDGKDDTCCNLIRDLVVVEFQLREVQNVG